MTKASTFLKHIGVRAKVDETPQGIASLQQAHKQPDTHCHGFSIETVRIIHFKCQLVKILRPQKRAVSKNIEHFQASSGSNIRAMANAWADISCQTVSWIKSDSWHHARRSHYYAKVANL